MTKIDIISGFLGAGKTTLIKKLLKEVFQGQKIVLIENEFGEIGIDGGFLKDAGIQITEMNSGCICCSLVGDFGAALKQVVTTYAPDRIIIEPSGVGKLSDVIAAVVRTSGDIDIELNNFVTVADAHKCRIYMKNFGEFYNNQIESANTVILSRTQDMDEAKLEAVVKLLQEKNPKAKIITTPWDALNGRQILDAMEQGHSLTEELMKEAVELARRHEEEEEEHEHHHHEHDEEEHEHHHHEHDEEEHEHHHHEHDEEEHEHHHHGHDEEEGHEHCHGEGEEHHHHHDGECSCGHHHHHHHADEIFTSWGKETPKKFEKSELENILKTLAEGDAYGTILRAKGMVPQISGEWLHFDLVPGEYEIRNGAADYTGRLCVIGSNLKEDALAELFGL